MSADLALSPRACAVCQQAFAPKMAVQRYCSALCARTSRGLTADVAHPRGPVRHLPPKRRARTTPARPILLPPRLLAECRAELDAHLARQAVAMGRTRGGKRAIAVPSTAGVRLRPTEAPMDEYGHRYAPPAPVAPVDPSRPCCWVCGVPTERPKQGPARKYCDAHRDYRPAPATVRWAGRSA